MKHLRLYLHIGAFSLMALTLALTLVLATPSLEGSITRQTHRLIETPMRRIAWSLYVGVPADALEDELGSAVVLVPLKDAPDKVRGSLKDGSVEVTFAWREMWAWVALPDRETIVRVGPIAQVKPEKHGRGLQALGIGLLLSFLASGILARSLGRQLLALSRAADRLGEGDLTARAPVFPRSATKQLAERFNAMADQLGALIDSQQELLRAVSHDLRTPMSRMRFSLTLLETAPPEQKPRHLARLETDLSAMDLLLQELLRYIRLRGEQVTDAATEPIALGPLMAQLREELSMLRPSLSIVLEPGPAVMVRREPGRLHRALENIGANATRFAAERVRLSWRLARSTVEIRIEDDGPGIPAAERQRVFEPFVRLEGARNLDQHSSGLGLAIAAQIVARHQGQISIQESASGGAAVLVVLPVDAAASPVSGSAALDV